MSKEPMIEFGGLWSNEGPSGEYWSGNIGAAKLLIFRNNRKTKDNQPDLNMFLAMGKRQAEWENKKTNGESQQGLDNNGGQGDSPF